MNNRANFTWAAPLFCFCLAAYFQLNPIEWFPGNETAETASKFLMASYILLAVALFAKMHNIIPVLGAGSGIVGFVLNLSAFSEFCDELSSKTLYYVDDSYLEDYYKHVDKVQSMGTILLILIILSLAFVFVNILVSIPQFAHLIKWDTVIGEMFWFLPIITMIVIPLLLFSINACDLDKDYIIELIAGDESGNFKAFLWLATAPIGWSFACKWYSDPCNLPKKSNPAQQQGGYQQQPYQQQPYYPQQGSYVPQQSNFEDTQQVCPPQECSQPMYEQPVPTEQQNTNYQQPQTAPQDPSQNESAERQDG